MTQFKSILPVDEHGFYGRFGGAYIPEVLHGNIERLREAFYRYAADPEFNAEFDRLMRDYVGRPSPLFRADNLSSLFVKCLTTEPDPASAVARLRAALGLS